MRVGEEDQGIAIHDGEQVREREAKQYHAETAVVPESNGHGIGKAALREHARMGWEPVSNYM